MKQFIYSVTLMALFLVASNVQALTFEIIDGDGSLSDATPFESVSDNPGVTLGEQRMNAIQRGFSTVADRFADDTHLVVSVTFETNSGSPAAVARTLSRCDPATNYCRTYSEFKRDTGASAVEGEPDFRVVFYNTSSSDWSYELDNDKDARETRVMRDVAAHEFMHGMGILSLAQTINGKDRFSSLDQHLVDVPSGRSWTEMTEAEISQAMNDDHETVFNGMSTNMGADIITSGLIQGMLRMSPTTAHIHESVTPKHKMQLAVGVSVNSGIGIETCLLADLGWTIAEGFACPDLVSTPYNETRDRDGDGVSDKDDLCDFSEPGAVVNERGCTDSSSSQPPVNGNGGSDVSGSSGGGGGCSMNGTGQGAFDPLFLVLLAGSLLVLRKRAL